MKLQRNGFDFIFLTGFTGLTGFFSPSARSPSGRRPFYPDDPVDHVQFSFKDENPFLFLLYFDLLAFLRFFFDQPGRSRKPCSYETFTNAYRLGQVNRGWKAAPTACIR